MGFERVTSIIQGTKNFTDFAGVTISNYETDIFRPIFDEIEEPERQEIRQHAARLLSALDSGPSTGHRTWPFVSSPITFAL